jgi:hypothetical protein
MPKFQHCSKSIAVFVILLYWPLAAAVGQMVEYGSAGFNEAAMQGSCAACQESYSEPEWYGAGYETYGSVPFADQCGCNECSAEIPGCLGRSGNGDALYRGVSDHAGVRDADIFLRQR